ncbi:hypothetical protein [Pseudorhodobacter aquimaris]|uniref:hypothetical protein n=1 Tax=Pseudorhodobacter aquimaris TaxID=687412 RepID=UPI00067A943A|nr:hypothetical protein [Pseudorhodobacter aquimaris]
MHKPPAKRRAALSNLLTGPAIHPTHLPKKRHATTAQSKAAYSVGRPLLAFLRVARAFFWIFAFDLIGIASYQK